MSNLDNIIHQKKYSYFKNILIIIIHNEFNCRLYPNRKEMNLTNEAAIIFLGDLHVQSKQ